MSVINGPRVAPPPIQSSLLKKGLKAAAGQAVEMGVKAGLKELEDLTGVRFDPAPAYLFYINISGLIVGMFTSCEGIQVTRSVEELTEGGVNDHTHSLPGHVTMGRITLKRGLSVSRELWGWFTGGLYDFQVSRVNMSIIQGAPGMNSLSRAGGTGPGIIKVWNLEGAYPVSWSLSGLDVEQTSSVAIESVEIAFETISLLPVAGTPFSPSSLV